MCFFKRETNIIKVTRDSFCMGDDALAPHLMKMKYHQGQSLNGWCKSLNYNYLPGCKNCVWVLKTKNDVIGYFYSCRLGYYQFELAAKNIKMSEIDFDEIHCSYYNETDFMKPVDGKSFIPSDPSTYYVLYPECRTLISKVKKHFSNNK